MNKLGIVLGATAIAVVSGCMDPNYELPGHLRSQTAPTQVAPADDDKLPGEQPETATVTPVDIATTDIKTCTCPPGTKHADPCECGAPDCKCIVETPVTPVPTAVLEPEPETTPYIVQSGDYLAKISRKFNIKIDAIRKANPQLKGDKIRVGQTIKLPGKVDVGEQKLPEKPARPAAPVYKSYEGPTVDYTVVRGDSLGKIAYSRGINIRQLKELNGLSGNNIRIGQKLKVPAGKAAAAAPAKVQPVKAPAKAAVAPVVADKPASAPAVVAPVAPVKEAKPAVAEPVVLTPDPVVEPAPAVVPEPAPVEVEPITEPVVVETPAADDAITYIVQEGEDIAGVAVTFSVDPAVIRQLNNFGPDEQLKPGQVIKIPGSAL